MISKLTDLNELSGVSSPLLPLIYSVGRFSSGNNCVYLQNNDSDEIKAVFSVKNGEAVLLYDEGTDIDELKSFFSIYSVESVVSDKPLHNFCESFREYPLMACDVENFTDEFSEGCNRITELSTMADYKKVYELISQNSLNFDEWYTEFSKKINSHSAFCSFYEIEDKVVSGAIINARFRDNVILSGVYTQNDFRHRGFANKCVSDVIFTARKFNLKVVFLWCEQNVVDFYKKLSFKEVSKIYVGECN